MKVTLVVPCYNEEHNVALFYEVADVHFATRNLSTILFLSMMAARTVLIRN